VSFGFLRRTVRKIENEVTEWVEKGVQATTDKRLVFLRAILYHACEKTKKINLGDIPYFPIRGKAADNVRQGKFSEADFSNILEELPKYLHPLVKFLHLTGMRSGQAKAITWDMIGDDNVLRMPGFLTKNGQPYSLPLTNKKAEPYDETAFMVNMKTRPHGGLVFATMNLLKEWRLACHKLKLGMYDPTIRSYRGAQLHDFRRTAASNMNAKVSKKVKGRPSQVTRPNSMYKRYGIVESDSQRDALDAVTAR
jgi:integrase